MTIHLLSWLCSILVGLLCAHGLSAQPTSRSSSEFITQSEGRKTAQEYVVLARQHIQEGRTAEARHVLSQAIAARHDLSEAYLLRAELRQEAHDLAGAITDYSVVIYQQPEHHEARFQRATVYFEVRRYEAAQADFQYLLDHPPGATNTIYFKQGHSGQEAVTGVTTLQSDMKVDLFNYLGLCSWHTQDYDQARSYFTRAIVHRPDDPLAYVNLGLTAEATGDTLRAIDYYQQALQKKPGHSVALRNVASLARQRNDTTLERQILSAEATSYDGWLQRGIYSLRQGEYESAVRQLTVALTYTDQPAEGLIQRGFAYEKALRPAEALADYSQAIRLNPQADQAYSNRGSVYFRQEHYERALADYNQALTLDSAQAKVWYNRGLTHQRLGHRDTACQDLQRALALGHAAASQPLRALCEER